jgi:hypothetical protein
MTMTRMFRRFVCRLMLGVLVFGQVGHRCLRLPRTVGHAAVASDDGPECVGRGDAR